MSEDVIKVLPRLIERFRGCRVGIVGDLILDEFIWGSVERISPEAPVPVVKVVRETMRLGGAANVAANLVSLGARPFLVGVLGDDAAGARFLRELEVRGIPRTGVAVESGRQTTVKTRIIANRQQVCRTDREDSDPIKNGTLEELRYSALALVESSSAVILSDYSKGVAAALPARDLIHRCQEQGRFIAVDPKGSDFSRYEGASIVTPNLKEAEQASGVLIRNEASLREAGRKLVQITESEFLLITQGEAGMALFQNDKLCRIPAAAREVFDVTGAGDTVIGVLSLAVAAGASIYEAALLANHAAGIVVEKVGTASATVDEMLDRLQDSSRRRNN